MIVTPPYQVKLGAEGQARDVVRREAGGREDAPAQHGHRPGDDRQRRGRVQRQAVHLG